MPSHIENSEFAGACQLQNDAGPSAASLAAHRCFWKIEENLEVLLPMVFLSLGSHSPLRLCTFLSAEVILVKIQTHIDSV